MRIRGIDTLEFGIDTNNYDEEFKKIIQELENEKIEAQRTMKKPTIKVNNVNFSVFPKGQGIYRYKIECEEFSICFSSKKIKSTPAIYIRFYSRFLWEYGYIQAYNKFMEWFSQFNVKEYKVKISRIDICFDIDEFEFKETDRGKFYSRANKLERMYSDSDHYNNKIFSGFVFGKGGNVSCRIYNKTLEIKKSNKKWFEDIWKKYGWNGENNVWRVEFQMRGKVLKELNFYTIDNVTHSLDNVWAYLTQNWLTIKIKGKDKNISRWKVDRRWEKVQKGGFDYIYSPAIRVKIHKGDIQKLLDLGGGVLTSIAGLQGDDNIYSAYVSVVKNMKTKATENNTTINEEIEKKRNRFI